MSGRGLTQDMAIAVLDIKLHPGQQDNKRAVCAPNSRSYSPDIEGLDCPPEVMITADGSRHMSYQNVLMPHAGIFAVCFSPFAGILNGGHDFSHKAGTIKVSGPVLQQKMTCKRGATCAITIVGFGLSPNDVGLLATRTDCTNEDLTHDPQVVNLFLKAGVGSATALTWNGVVANEEGTYKLCYSPRRDSGASERFRSPPVRPVLY